MKEKAKLSLAQCEGIAREATREHLRGYELPSGIREKLTLGSSLEDDQWIFELYIPGQKPQDGIVLTRTKVNRNNGICEVEVFLPANS
jgi:hypothetical protein